MIKVKGSGDESLIKDESVKVVSSFIRCSIELSVDSVVYMGLLKFLVDECFGRFVEFA